MVRTVSAKFPVPAVIRLNRWVQLKRKPSIIRFSRANIYLRDEFTCQYCVQQFHETELTLDHVIPVVRGGKKSWDNIVTACRRCNQTKGGRCPDKAGMELLKIPKAPKWLPDRIGIEGVHRPPKIWEPYLGLFSRS